MSSGMPELGSKISLISKADIRYEGRLFTVDPQECTIALASVRSFGTEDRETQYPVAPQSQVYDYILFRGSDIKDIRVLNNVPSLPNDPAIMQMSVPPTIGGNQPPQFGGSVPQFQHPVVGQSQFQQYHPMAGFPGSMQAQLNKTSELSAVDLAPRAHAGPIGSGMMHHANQVKDQATMLDLIGGGQNASRSGTPGLGGHRKSPTADQGTQSSDGGTSLNLFPTQVGAAGGSQQRRGSGTQQKQLPQQQQQPRQRNNSGNRNNRQRYPSGGNSGPMPPQHNQAGPPHHQHNHHTQQNQHNQHAQHNQHGQHNQHAQHNQHGQHNQHAQHNQHGQQGQNQMMGQQMHPGAMGGYGRGGGGGWRGRSRGRGRGFALRPGQKPLKFDNDYDFEQANTEFEELRNQLTKVKISDEPAKEEGGAAEVDKKDDSGNETGAGEPEVEEESQAYDKAKSFFDNISCEAVERSKGRSQRTDWRTERKLNSETFGVASARRGAWRGRGGWRQYPHHMQQMNSFSWRGGRGGGGGGGGGGAPGLGGQGGRGPRGGGQGGQGMSQPRAPRPQPQQQPQPVTAK